MKMKEITEERNKGNVVSYEYIQAAYSGFIISNIYSWQIPDISPCTALLLHLNSPGFTQMALSCIYAWIYDLSCICVDEEMDGYMNCGQNSENSL